MRERLRASMIRLREGERDAFSGVFSTLLPLVRRFAARTVGPEDADDVAQQALVKLFEQAADYDERRDVVAWALAITAWEVRTMLKRRARRKEAPLPPEDDLASTHPEDDLVRGLLAEEAQQVLGTLSAADRETLDAAWQGTGEGPTFRKRKSRAVARLRRAWRMRHG